MWVLLISLTATAIAQAGLAVVCFVRHPGTLLPAILLASLALSYATFATIGGGWLATFQQASSIDPVADWVDLLIQQVVVTGVLFASAFAVNLWLAFSIPVSTNAKQRPGAVDADGAPPVSRSWIAVWL